MGSIRVFILAGGFGHRLSGVIKDVPKPMAPIKGKPFLEILIRELKKKGLNELVILTGFKGNEIEEYFGNGSSFGVNISYSREKSSLGTGGAICKAARTYLSEDHLLVINGDTYFDVNIPYFINYHIMKGGLLTLALKYREDARRFGIVKTSGELVNGFEERPTKLEDGLINGGIYALRKEALRYFLNKKTFSFEKELVPLILEKKRAYGIPFSGKFIDIGIPDDYYLANRSLLEWISHPKIKAAFLDRDGIINQDDGYPYLPSKIRLRSGIVTFLKQLLQLGFKLVILTNQPGIAKGIFSAGDYLIFQRALIRTLEDRGIHILGSYHCPYHPNATIIKYRKKSYLRKPEPGMALKAADVHFIDLAKSIMIGDKESDRLNLPYLKSLILKHSGDISRIHPTDSDLRSIINQIKIVQIHRS